MPLPVDELCSRHNYPGELRDVLHRLVEATQQAYPAATSFVLSGSGATGDYVFRDRDGTVELISDLDMTLFTTGDGATPERLDRVVEEIESRNRSALFQVDIAIVPPSSLDNIASSYQMAETKRAGVVLAGEDVLSHYPDAFDPLAARRSFLGNLWKPFLYWSPANSGGDMTYCQVAARVFLDVPLLAAAKRGECVPGHRARAEQYLASSERSGLYSEPLRERVRWAIDARTRPHTDRAGLEGSIAEFAFEVTKALDDKGDVPRNPDRALVDRLAAWLPSRTPRRFGGELRSLVRDPHSPLRDLRWLFDKKEAVAGAAMLGMLAHLATGEGEAPTAQMPGGIGARLGEFSRRPTLIRRESETALEFVARCRNAYAEGLSTLYPSLAKKDPGIVAFMGVDQP